MVCPPTRGAGTNTKSYDLSQSIATARAKVDSLRARQSATESDWNATREKTETAKKAWQDAQTRLRAADTRIRELETAARTAPAADSPERKAALERLKKAETAYAECRRTVVESLAKTADYRDCGGLRGPAWTDQPSEDARSICLEFPNGHESAASSQAGKEETP